MVVAASIADFADYVNVRQEIHFNPALSFALAGLATAARNVEREAPGLVTALARLRKHGVQVADLREHAGVGGRVRPGRTANRRLVDPDNLVDGIRTGDGFVRAGFLA